MKQQDRRKIPGGQKCRGWGSMRGLVGFSTLNEMFLNESWFRIGALVKHRPTRWVPSFGAVWVYKTILTLAVSLLDFLRKLTDFP